MTAKDNLLGGKRGPLVVTGAGILSAAGRGMRTLVEALDARDSFLGFLPAARRGVSTGEPLAGLVPEAAIPGTGPRRTVRLASTALADAVRVAWSERRPVPGARTGVSLGTALGSVEDVELEVYPAGRPAAGACGHYEELSFAAFAERVTEHAAELDVAGPQGFAGPRSVFSATCVSGLCALEQAAADIALGRADAMAVGGIDTLSNAMLAGFRSLGVVTGNGALRPFEGRDGGIAIGEAACFVIVEPLVEALGASASPPPACILSQALESDAYHLTTPDPSGRGMARAIRRAMAQAGLTANDLGGILVTAAGSPVYDHALSRAVEDALGSRARRIPVSTWECAVGHVLAATGIVAIAFAAEVLARGELPPVYPVASGGEPAALRVDSECRLDYVLEAPRELEAPSVLVLVVGFGGQNGAVVLSTREWASGRQEATRP